MLRGRGRLEPAGPPPRLPAASLGLRRPPRTTPPPAFTLEPSGNATATAASAAPRQQRTCSPAASHRRRGARPLARCGTLTDAHWMAALPLPLARPLSAHWLTELRGVSCRSPPPSHLEAEASADSDTDCLNNAGQTFSAKWNVPSKTVGGVCAPSWAVNTRSSSLSLTFPRTRPLRGAGASDVTARVSLLGLGRFSECLNTQWIQRAKV